jgi:hypothetical protein
MAYLEEAELLQLYAKAGEMTAPDRVTYLSRANAYAFGLVKGDPPADMDTTTLKAAVAMAFEILAKPGTSATDPDTGNITNAAPAGAFTQKAEDPLTVVRVMLQPYAEAVARANSQKSVRGIQFL